MSVEKRRKNLDSSIKKFIPPDFSSVRTKKSSVEEGIRTKSPSKENTLNQRDKSVQALKSSQQQNEKVIELLMKEKRMMEREISILKNRLSQRASQLSTDDIGLRQEEGKGDAEKGKIRPSSAPIRRHQTGTSLSLELQADIDRYIRRRRELEEQERRARDEQAKYEEELQRRFARASLKAHEFTGLMERQREAEKQKEVRQSRRLQQAKAAASRERREHEQQRRLRSERPPLTGLSWREIEAQQEERRKQRVETRKLSIMSMSSPFKAAEPLPPRKRLNEEPPASAFVFTAKDPQEVVTRLSQQQETWRQRLEAIKQRNKNEKATKASEKTSIEKRAEEYARKREERKRLQQEKERLKEEQGRRSEEQKRKRLLSMKIPDASKRLTRSVELKIGEVRKSKEKMLEEERLREEEEKKRARAMRETGAVVRTIVSEVLASRTSFK